MSANFLLTYLYKNYVGMLETDYKRYFTEEEMFEDIESMESGLCDFKVNEAMEIL